MLDRRIKFRQGLSNLYIPYYDALCALLPMEWQPYQGLRTVEEQEAIYAKGRTAPGAIVTNANGSESAHIYGCATDWAIFTPNGQVIWLHKDDGMWNDYVTAVEKVGLKAGKDFGDIDHNELLIKVPYKSISTVYNTSGMQAAMDNIQKMMA